MNTLSVKGPQVPDGVVRVSGAKNSATRLLAAAMLADEEVLLTDFPTTLLDCKKTVAFIEAMNGEVFLDEDASEARVRCGGLSTKNLDNYDFPIRTTYLLVAGQLQRNGVARIPYPGGCKLGARGYDLHIMIWESMGCVVTEYESHIYIKGSLQGTDINFPISTVGGTENALLCASIARGKTTIYNAYITPEVENLMQLLLLMGARIDTSENGKITIEGVSRLHSATIQVIPDRIEVITWMALAAITGGEILIENVPFADMEIPLAHMRNAGLAYFRNEASIIIPSQQKLKRNLKSFEVACGSHPGIISDMQPFFVLLALCTQGRSVIMDYRYPDRIAYVEELAKLCSNRIQWERGRIIVEGPGKLAGSNVESTDLRGSMALIMAAFIAEGESSIKQVDMAMRGYNNLWKKLSALGLKFNLSES